MAYNLEWRDVPTLTTTQVLGIADLFHDLSGLTEATAYEFRVQEIDGTAQSSWSEWHQFTTASSAVTINFSLTQAINTQVNVERQKVASLDVVQGLASSTTTGQSKQSVYAVGNGAEIALSSEFEKSGVHTAQTQITATDELTTRKTGWFDVQQGASVNVNVLASSKDFRAFGVAVGVSAKTVAEQIKNAIQSAAITVQITLDPNAVKYSTLWAQSESGIELVANQVKVADQFVELVVKSSANFENDKRASFLVAGGLAAQHAASFGKQGVAQLAQVANGETFTGQIKWGYAQADLSASLLEQISARKIAFWDAEESVGLEDTASLEKTGFYGINEGGGISISLLIGEGYETRKIVFPTIKVFSSLTADHQTSPAPSQSIVLPVTNINPEIAL